MFGIRRLAEQGLVLRELWRVRRELSRLTTQVERIADALEAHNANSWPQTIPPPATSPERPAVEVSYVSNHHQALMMEIEMRLTKARGMAPTDEEVLAEYERIQEQRIAEQG